MTTLSRCIAGKDENSSQTMTGAVAAVDRLREALNCLVLLVHHSGKNEAQADPGARLMDASVHRTEARVLFR